MAVLTAVQGRNDVLFRDIASVYLKPGAVVLDMTWGKGNFWREVDQGQYELYRNDLVTEGADFHFDLRDIKLPSEIFDAVILDPPYAKHGATPMKASIASPYQNNHETAPKSYKEVMELYKGGFREAARLLKSGGYLVAKCQDQIESGKQKWVHVDLLTGLMFPFHAEDLFILVQPTAPAQRQQEQKHARKNHSYFVVLRRL